MADPLIVLMGKFMTHLPEGVDNNISILKGHLICEEQLYRSLNANVIEPKYIEKANLKFGQLLEITKAHYFKQEDSWLWGALQKLNTIRNMLSHNLEPVDFEKNLIELIILIEQNIIPSEKNKSFEERLRFSLAMLAGKIHSLERINNA